MPRIVPDDWMPPATIKRIHVHWTAGGHKANEIDLKSYHILVEGDGEIRRGKHSIAANGVGAKGPQASHTLKGNTGAIGVSLCCMRQSVERPFNPGPSPLTPVQWKRGIEVIADLAERYGVPVAPTTILTHAEVHPNLNIRQKNKWDISRLAFDDRFDGPKAVGDEMRIRVAEMLGKDKAPAAKVEAIPEDLKLPRFRVTGVAPSTLNFRRAPGGEKVGELPERAVVERIGVFGEWWQVRTKAGFMGFVHSAFLTPA